ncbi:ANTAR domain-containing response regulator [Lignipirellula cremea]|uniref:Putative transcriptional regulatory protein pdtaR n=1 Tax=Lignipirellula cremea TaxID=2528010 RepID=A0A518E2Q6_9BACT|nr:ANTAR domain-containing protein [Lignipirellula cremea]QDU98352.1 putative transcriptional regulatory protein pdtaR [Lignipirellula cremea]
MKNIQCFLIDNDPAIQFQDAIRQLGYRVTLAKPTADERTSDSKPEIPDVLAFSAPVASQPALRDLVAAYHRHPAPIVAVAPQQADGSAAAFLLRPLQNNRLDRVLQEAADCFSESERLRQENQELRQCLEDRKIIEKAKGILMKTRNIDENRAFHHLQHVARSQSIKMVDVARVILSTTLDPVDG